MDFLEKEVLLISSMSAKRYSKLENVKLTYFCDESPFGYYMAAFYDDQLCYLKFFDQDFGYCLKKLEILYRNAVLTYNDNFQPPSKLKLFVIGTEFEVSVWKELLKIQKGKTVNYHDIAASLGHPKSARPVGNAIGKNPIAYIIPCHRVIRKDGQLGGFTSGPHRKLKMLSFEDLQNLRVGKKVSVTLETRDSQDHVLERGGEYVTAEIRYRDAGISRSLMVNVLDKRDGTYGISFVPDVAGKLVFIIKVKGEHIQGSPFPVTVRSLKPHHGTFHCCSFCSSGGNKEASCGCDGKMPGGYKGCGHGHDGHPGRRHWSCCGNVLEHSECGRSRSNSHYQFTL